MEQVEINYAKDNSKPNVVVGLLKDKPNVKIKERKMFVWGVINAKTKKFVSLYEFENGKKLGGMMTNRKTARDFKKLLEEKYPRRKFKVISVKLGY